MIKDETIIKIGSYMLLCLAFMMLIMAGMAFYLVCQLFIQSI